MDRHRNGGGPVLFIVRLHDDTVDILGLVVVAHRRSLNLAARPDNGERRCVRAFQTVDQCVAVVIRRRHRCAMLWPAPTFSWKLRVVEVPEKDGGVLV